MREAFVGADVAVHLAFMITGNAAAATIRAINVEFTLDAFSAARDAGVKRFVYASSVAASGFHRDSPVGMREDWPIRPAERLFYAREQAELEQLLHVEADEARKPALYLVRPPVVLGPHAVGAQAALPGPEVGAGRRSPGRATRAGGGSWPSAAGRDQSPARPGADPGPAHAGPRIVSRSASSAV